MWSFLPLLTIFERNLLRVGPWVRKTIYKWWTAYTNFALSEAIFEYSRHWKVLHLWYYISILLTLQCVTLDFNIFYSNRQKELAKITDYNEFCHNPPAGFNGFNYPADWWSSQIVFSDLWEDCLPCKGKSLINPALVEIKSWLAKRFHPASI